MNKLILTILILFFFSSGYSQTVSLHPLNPHYLTHKGNPLVLVTSAEHYGSVLNLDFDFEKYLQTLHVEGMNYTRIFAGTYAEIPGSFGIKNNSLAPAVGSFLAPWKRTGEPGIFKGEKKFDLSQWNDEYFDRLKAFVGLAEKLEIIVEVTFFCSTYQDNIWERSPFNPGNNVNNLPVGLDRKKSNTLGNGVLTSFQKEMVHKIVTELNEFDNVFYEIQNEPWSDDPYKVMRTLRTLDPQQGQGNWYKWAEMASPASLEWQKEIAKTVVQTEAELSKKHLIAQNYTNFKHSVAWVDPNVSIMNFHYVWPEAVWLNYGWDRPVNFDESGFAGASDTTYLRQAWQFMMAGGGIFNNLDYSFYVGKEDGTGENEAPGGGSRQLRRQLLLLRNFIESFDFVKMKPDFTCVRHSPGLDWQAISEPGKQYAMVFTGVSGNSILLEIPRGKYDFEFINPFDGKKLKSGFFTHKTNAEIKFPAPPFSEMFVLKIVKQTK